MSDSDNKTTFTIELSEKKDCKLLVGRGSLFYCRILKDGECIHTRQTLTVDRAYLLALQLLSKDFHQNNTTAGLNGPALSKEKSNENY